MSEERLQRERTKGLRALTPPCPRLQAKKLQPLPTSQRKPSTGRLPPCKVWNVSKLVGSRGGRNVWKRAMTVGSGIIGSCIVGFAQSKCHNGGAEGKQATPHLGGPTLLLLLELQAKDLGTQKGSLHEQYQVWPIICAPSRGGGYLVGW